MGPVRGRVIRAATLDDLDALLTLNSVVQQWHADHYPDVFRTDPDPALMRRFFAEQIADETCHVLICEDLSGYVFARRHAGKETPYGWKLPEMHVEHIAVLPNRQREGIGSALLSAAEAIARSAGCARLTLDTWAANSEAQRMFEASGLSPLRHHYAKALR